MKQSIILFLLSSILLGSCTPDPLDIDIPQPPQKLALSSQIIPVTESTPTEMFAVVLTKSFGALEKKDIGVSSGGLNFPQELLVQDAVVWLVSGNERILMRSISNGVYALEQLPGSDYSTYDIEVNNYAGELMVTAQTQRLPKAKFSECNINFQPAENTYLLRYTFSDLPGEQNWYVVSYYTKDSQRDTIPADERANIDYIAKRMLEQPLDFDLVSESDMISGIYSSEKKVKPESADSVVVSLSNITKGYYDFLAARKRAGTLMNQLKGEVVNLPTNIKGGYGYFNMSNPDYRVLEKD